jgi:hypothetical protein
MKYRVIVRATYEEVFDVEAADEKEAESKSIDADCIESTNVWNETQSIAPLLSEGESIG